MKKVTAWSISALKFYESCPRRHYYVKIEGRKEPQSPAMARGNKIHLEAAKYLGGEVDDFPITCVEFKDQFKELREMKPVVEQKWAFNQNWVPVGFFAKDVRCRVIIDASLIYDDYSAEVIDHKTGKRYDDDYMDQLGLFAAATIKMFPRVDRVTTRLWYLDSGDEVVEEIAKDQALDILNNLEYRAGIMMQDTRFVPRSSWKCKYCHFRKANDGPCEFG